MVRATAGTILAGSLALGMAAARGGRARPLVQALALASAGYAASAVATARWRRARPGAGDGPVMRPGSASTPLLQVSVIIPARNEVGVLPALLADLAGQDHRQADGTPCYEVVVIDDRSTDGTGVAARQAIERHGLGGLAHVVRRALGPGGKAAALAAVPLTFLQGDIVAVFDADARLASNVLSRGARHIADGNDAVTARRRVVTARPGGAPTWLARVQDDEQTVDAALQAARWSLGGCTEFRGDGMFIRKDRLVAAGGWARCALTEDLELSTRLAARLGVRVATAPDVVVWEEAVPGQALWPQRLRWAEGTIRRQLELTTAIWGSASLGAMAKIDYSLYGLQSVVAPTMLGLLIGSAATRSWRTAGLVGSAYALSGSCIGALVFGPAGREDGGPWPRTDRLWRGLRMLVFEMHWLVVLPVAWLRIAIQRAPGIYAPTPHRGLGSSWHPPSPAEPGLW